MPVTIINADATQVYRDLRVVSARPSLAEERSAPHRLFGHVDGSTPYSAAQWAEDARQAIARVRESWRIPLLVGGTGLYLRTLLDGIAPVPDVDPDIRRAVRALPVRDAHAALTIEDPEAAGRLSPNDTTRVARALEVVRSTGRPLACWQTERRGGIAASVRLVPLVLLPPRDWLFARCDARFRTMLDEGAREEVAALLARKLDPGLPVMRAIGVPEIARLLAIPGEAEAAIADAQTATRNYAKRQYTWFRNQTPAAWPRVIEHLNNDMIDKLAIKLRQMTLTE